MKMSLPLSVQACLCAAKKFIKVLLKQWQLHVMLAGLFWFSSCPVLYLVSPFPDKSNTISAIRLPFARVGPGLQSHCIPVCGLVFPGEEEFKSVCLLCTLGGFLAEAAAAFIFDEEAPEHKIGCLLC